MQFMYILTSRYKPYTTTPSAGAPLISSGVVERISKAKDKLSMASKWSRAYVCSDAVMNPWGKKNTGRGKAQGLPSVSQDRKKLTRNVRSVTQDPNDFKDAKESFNHIEGTWK